MRRQQIRIISYSFLIANIFAAVELFILISINDKDAIACAELCAEPRNILSAWLLLLIDLCHLLPMELFIVSFYVIPRRFYASGDEEEIKLDIHMPLI